MDPACTFYFRGTLQHGQVNDTFDPTSDNGTGLAFATLAGQFRNTAPGKRGVFCEACHTNTATRYTPYHNYQRTGTEYTAAALSRSAGPARFVLE